jgi:hypothetical protein
MKKGKACSQLSDALKDETLTHQIQQVFFKLFNQNPASMAIRRISDNMMLNANNFF